MNTDKMAGEVGTGCKRPPPPRLPDSRSPLFLSPISISSHRDRPWYSLILTDPCLMEGLLNRLS